MSRKVNFVEAASLGFKNYARFRGTASRSEFWHWTLFTVLLSMVLGTIESVIWPAPDIAGDSFEDPLAVLDIPTPLTSIASLVLFLPNLAITARRFRDAGFSAKWLLASLLPGIYAIFAFVGVAAILGTTEYDAAMGIEQTMPIIFLIIPLFALIALVLLMFLIFTLKPTKSFYDGNKYAEPQPLGPGDDVGTTA